MRGEGFRTGLERRAQPLEKCTAPPMTANNSGDFLTHEEVDTLMSRTDANFFKGQKGAARRQRTYSVDTSNILQTQVKPKILESRCIRNSDFYTLGEGFKKVFADDSKDQKMVVPVVGYGGHLRGDRSQNFFGKSFRDISLRSKCLEREFRSSQPGL